jgi:hypothetical protein
MADHVPFDTLQLFCRKNFVLGDGFLDLILAHIRDPGLKRLSYLFGSAILAYRHNRHFLRLPAYLCAGRINPFSQLQNIIFYHRKKSF